MDTGYFSLLAVAETQNCSESFINISLYTAAGQNN
jgi:hypothetical protein